MTTVEVTITCEVTDPKALWRAARAQMVRDGAASPGDIDLSETIGTERSPDIGSCLRMLLDRPEHLVDAGASILDSSAE